VKLIFDNKVFSVEGHILLYLRLRVLHAKRSDHKGLDPKRVPAQTVARLMNQSAEVAEGRFCSATFFPSISQPHPATHVRVLGMQAGTTSGRFYTGLLELIIISPGKHTILRSSCHCTHVV